MNTKRIVFLMSVFTVAGWLGQPSAFAISLTALRPVIDLTQIPLPSWCPVPLSFKMVQNKLSTEPSDWAFVPTSIQKSFSSAKMTTPPFTCHYSMLDEYQGFITVTKAIPANHSNCKPIEDHYICNIYNGSATSVVECPYMFETQATMQPTVPAGWVADIWTKPSIVSYGAYQALSVSNNQLRCRMAGSMPFIWRMALTKE